jgi:hypothetical protein
LWGEKSGIEGRVGSNFQFLSFDEGNGKDKSFEIVGKRIFQKKVIFEV